MPWNKLLYFNKHYPFISCFISDDVILFPQWNLLLPCSFFVQVRDSLEAVDASIGYLRRELAKDEALGCVNIIIVSTSGQVNTDCGSVYYLSSVSLVVCLSNQRPSMVQLVDPCTFFAYYRVYYISSV